MKAKDMFKDLGYKKLPKKANKDYIFYIEIEQNVVHTYLKKTICFSLTYKGVQFSPFLRYSTKELKAINKQIEELGW